MCGLHHYERLSTVFIMLSFLFFIMFLVFFSFFHMETVSYYLGGHSSPGVNSSASTPTLEEELGL